MDKDYILTIELVPSSSWLENVRKICSKEQWDFIRKKVYIKAKYCCEICGGKGSAHPVEAHEIWHYDDINFIQKLYGIIALCPACHEVKHIGLAEINGNLDKAVAHLIKVNKISEKKAKKYIEYAFKTWVTRSKNKWKLDLSYLKTFGINISKIKENE